jgi:Rrf2 family protein
MMSQTSRYALGILGFLVRADGSRSRSEDIAQSTGIPANYLSKILNQLRKQGLVEAEKGWGGGFRLRPEALKRPIEEILAIFEGVGSTNREDCVFGHPECNSDNPCPLHPYWERIRGAYREMLSRTTVADLGGRVGRGTGKKEKKKKRQEKNDE